MSKKTYEAAKIEINNKYPYLTLINYVGNNKEALFLDSEFGEFSGNYKNVLRGHKSHRERALISRKEKFVNTCLEKYGVKNPFESAHIKSKIIKTNIEKYGVDYFVKTNEFKLKSRFTLNQNYGVDSPMKSNIIRSRAEKTCKLKYGFENPSSSPFIKYKRQRTVFKRFGVKYVSQSDIIKNKIYNTCMLKYDNPTWFGSLLFKNKVKEANLKKYGVDNVFKFQGVINKIRITNIKKYGYSSPSKSKIVKDKVSETCEERFGNNKYVYSDHYKDKMMLNGSWHNINGDTLLEFYKNSNLPVLYDALCKNYKRFGDIALSEEHYKNISGRSKAADLWLDNVEKILGYDIIREFKIPNTIYVADGFDSKTNTIYEFYGDYWHGNPRIFKSSDIFHSNITFGDLYAKTMDRERHIKKLGYFIVKVWESD